MPTNGAQTCPPLSARLSLPARLSSLTPLSKGLHAFLAHCTALFAALDPAVAYGVDLAISEAVTNIIRHGVGKRTHQRIDIELHYSPCKLEAVVCDRGHPIPADLLWQKKQQHWDHWRADDPTSWPEGGLGLMLIYAMMDEVIYSVDTPVNRLQLIKYLP